VAETVAARATVREARREAAKVRTKLLSQIDERRNPRSRVTVNDLIDRWLDVAKLEPTTRQGYVGKIEKHIRPTIGRVEVGKLDAETIDSLYAALRRCKEHCGGRPYVEHRTAVAHDCAGGDGVRACGPHRCMPLSDGSIRVIHSILKTSLNRAVRWKWIAVNPISFVEPPPIPAPVPADSRRSLADPGRGVPGSRLGHAGLAGDGGRCPQR